MGQNIIIAAFPGLLIPCICQIVQIQGIGTFLDGHGMDFLIFIYNFRIILIVLIPVFHLHPEGKLLTGTDIVHPDMSCVLDGLSLLSAIPDDVSSYFL